MYAATFDNSIETREERNFFNSGYYMNGNCECAIRATSKTSCCIKKTPTTESSENRSRWARSIKGIFLQGLEKIAPFIYFFTHCT